MSKESFLHAPITRASLEKAFQQYALFQLYFFDGMLVLGGVSILLKILLFLAAYSGWGGRSSMFSSLPEPLMPVYKAVDTILVIAGVAFLLFALVSVVRQIVRREWTWLAVCVASLFVVPMSIPLFIAYYFLSCRPQLEGSVPAAKRRALFFTKTFLVLLMLLGPIWAGFGLVRFAVSMPGLWRDMSALSDELTEEPALCIGYPDTSEIGGTQYPIAPAYSHLPFLGQIFTAADCGDARLAEVAGGSDALYELGSALWVKPGYPAELNNIAQAIGYTLGGEDAEGIRKFELWSPVRIEQLLQLQPYAEYFETDDCRMCG